ncbi:MAG: histidine kinase [Bacteroidota bacterium]
MRRAFIYCFSFLSILGYACTPQNSQDVEAGRNTEEVRSWKLNLGSGYTTSQLDGSPVQPMISSRGDTLLTGKPLPMTLEPNPEQAIPHRVEAKVELLAPDPFLPQPLKQAPKNWGSLQGLWKPLPDSLVYGNEPIRVEGSVADSVYSYQAPAPLPAREGEPIPTSSFNMIRLGLSEGLPSEQLSACYVTQRGDVWMASAGVPLIRYDGHHYYPMGAEEGFPMTTVTDITEDALGNLWFISAGEGIVKFDGLHFYHFFKHPVFRHYGRMVLTDDMGAMWIATNAGLLRGYQGTFQYHSLAGASCLSLYQDPEGGILISTLNQGVIKYEQQTFWAMPEPVKSSFHFVSGFWRQPGGALWMSQYGRGIMKWQGDSVFLYTQEAGLPSSRNSFIVGDERGTLWVGNDDVGLFGMDTQSEGIISTQGLEFFNLRFFSLDPAGSIWIGSLGHGIFQLSPQYYEFLTLLGGKPLNTVSHMMEEDDGTVWLTTDGDGMLRWQEGQVTQFTFPGNIGLNHLTHITQGPDGDIWIGLIQGGFLRYDGTHFEHYSLLKVRPVDLLWDSRGRLWMTAYTGQLLMWDSQTLFQVMIGDKSPAFAWLGNLTPGAEPGELWLPLSSGLLHIQEEQATYLAGKEGIFIPELYSMQQDGSGGYWLGTREGLLNLQQETISFVPFHETDLELKPFTLAEDDFERLWIGGTSGLATFYPATREIQSVHLPGNHHFQYGGAYRAIHKLLPLSDGSTWGATQQNLFRFFPTEQLPMAQPSSPALSFIKANNASISQLPDDQLEDRKIRFSSLEPLLGVPQNLSLPPDQNHLTFGFRASSLASPSNIRFRYRIVDLESEWSLPSERATAEYRSLPSGKHALAVQTRLTNGPWSPTLTYSFVIRPPWYQTPWAYAAFVILSLGLLWLGFRWRLGTYRKQADQKAKIVQSELTALKAQMNPHFVFNALSSIQRFILKNDSVQANEYLNKYSRLMRQILDQSGRLLITLAEEIQTTQNYVELEKLRLSHKFTYEIGVAPMLKPERIRIPSMITQPYIENAIWHGLSPLQRPCHLIISFVPNGDMLVITVEDNGVGRATANMINPRKGVSKGSKITQERLERLNQTTYRNMPASFEIQDLEDEHGNAKGTRVVIRVPLDQIA